MIRHWLLDGIPHPTTDLGEPLAAAFAAALVDVAESYFAIVQGWMTFDELNELAAALPRAIGAAGDEREA